MDHMTLWQSRVKQPRIIHLGYDTKLGSGWQLLTTEWGYPAESALNELMELRPYTYGNMKRNHAGVCDIERKHRRTQGPQDHVSMSVSSESKSQQFEARAH